MSFSEQVKYCFNPRSPCGERRARHRPFSLLGLVSTHAPLAGSDPLNHARVCSLVVVSTHAPLAGSDGPSPLRSAADRVSTHAPLAGSDALGTGAAVGGDPVSTHAPLAGSDEGLRVLHVDGHSFNPRSPCGERLERIEYTNDSGWFQPTLPLRGATATSC